MYESSSGDIIGTKLTQLLGLTGVAGQDVELQVIQHDKFMSVATGETATLNCSLTSLIPVGPVKWFRERMGDRGEIYNFGGKGHYPRVTSASNATKRDNLDFSIRIRDMNKADTGLYYCVKFQKGSMEDREFKSGLGTWVIVSAKGATVTSRVKGKRRTFQSCYSLFTHIDTGYHFGKGKDKRKK
ncbi:signal-regulatory protein beta-1-like [Sorex fumeus]|uniref:signal-regulatory protein beta-1-like n=1 Tax=Sorex fumeus TaxID=62283 RepID=UPI0024AE47AE|nr:signal-regulatory protein beta-1-like [Sorex fumeus]